MAHSVIGRNIILIHAHIRAAIAAIIITVQRIIIPTTITPVRIMGASTATIIHGSIRLIDIDISFFGFDQSNFCFN